MKKSKTVYPNKPFLTEIEFLRHIRNQLAPAEKLIGTVQMVAQSIAVHDTDIANTILDAVASYREEMKQL